MLPQLISLQHRVMTFLSEPMFLVGHPSKPKYRILSAVGHFYFTKLLIPALIAGAKSSTDGKARVVNLSSVAAYLTKSFDLDMAQDLPQRKKASPTYLYGQSKLVCISDVDRLHHSYREQGNLLFSNELAKRYGDQGIISSAVHPGPLQSDLYRDLSFIERMVLVSLQWSKSFFSSHRLLATITLSSFLWSHNSFVGRDIARRTPI